MSAYRLSSRYAKSLLDLAIERNKVEDIYKDIQLINSVVDSSREFVLMIKSPIIHLDKKENVLHAVFKGKVDEITMKFIDILLLKGREGYLDDIARAFVEQYNSYKHITPVKLITAAPADDNLKNKVVALLKQKAGLQNIELTTGIDSSLIGGYVLQFEDKLYDASVRNKIQKLKREFSQNKFVKTV